MSAGQLDLRRNRRRQLAGCLLGVMVAVGGIGAALYLDMVSKPAASTTDARIDARRALLKDPINAGNMRRLAQKEIEAGQSKRAAKLMAVAGALSHRDVGVQLWLMNWNIEGGRLDDAMINADAALRTSPRFWATIFEVLAARAEDPSLNAALARRLATNPPWRLDFIGRLSERTDPAVTAQLLQSLKKDSPIADQEIEAILRQYLDRGRPHEARAIWEFLRTPLRSDNEQYIYNGDFESVRGPRPFNWTYNSGPGYEIRVDAEPSAGRGKALFVKYDGLRFAQFARQTTTIAPGEYKLTGSAFASIANSDKYFEWTVMCSKSGQLLLKLRPSSSGSWRAFSGVFNVPPQNCESQFVDLQSVTARRRTDIEAWFDNLAIVSTVQ